MTLLLTRPLDRPMSVTQDSLVPPAISVTAGAPWPCLVEDIGVNPENQGTITDAREQERKFSTHLCPRPYL
jgi:hypothetical protein